MALSIVDVLVRCEKIDEDALAECFAQRFTQQPWRGYGAGARFLLAKYAAGADWKDEAPQIFNGGSYGNGGAMRAAPIGGYFSADPERAAAEARRSASVTHAHIEGQAGAMAIAAAAAIWAVEKPVTGATLLNEVTSYLPATQTRTGIEAAAHIPAHEHARAVAELGTGNMIAAFDTVPYCLWIIAHHAPDFETALWATVAGEGDRDTTCAIVGGVVALQTAIPANWLAQREALPAGFSEV
jgi:ADP-ribosylglycohydrolase